MGRFDILLDDLETKRLKDCVSPRGPDLKRKNLKGGALKLRRDWGAAFEGR